MSLVFSQSTKWGGDLKVPWTIARLVPEIALPLNVLAWPGLPPVSTLQRLGVRRLSAGGGIACASLNATFALARTFLAEGRSEPFGSLAIKSSDLNAMMRKG